MGARREAFDDARLGAPASMGEVAIAIAPTAVSSTDRAAILRNQGIVNLLRPAGAISTGAQTCSDLAAARCSRPRAAGEHHPPRLNASRLPHDQPGPRATPATEVVIRATSNEVAVPD